MKSDRGLRGRGFEFFLYERENLGGLGFFSSKTLENLKKSLKGRGVDPQSPSLNTPLVCLVSGLVYELLF